MGQSWERLLFAHWRVSQSELQQLIPPGLEVDTYEGDAWLGLTPFRVTGLHPRLVPPLPGLSTFLETNIRTYVVRDGKPGILFFSLLATSRLAVKAARVAYCLPYRWAQGAMRQQGGTTTYSIRPKDHRTGPAGLRLQYAPAGAYAPATAGSLTHWLVERYCLYSRTPGGRLLRADIHHLPWSISPAEGSLECRDLAPAGLRPFQATPLLHVADRQDVLVWPPIPA